MSELRERQLIENLERENQEMRQAMFAHDRHAMNEKLAVELALVEAREARQSAERSTAILAAKEEARRNEWIMAEIKSHVADGMPAEQVFDPRRLDHAVDVHMSSGEWPGGPDQERSLAFLWSHLEPAGDRHSSLGPDDKSPLEQKLAALLK